MAKARDLDATLVDLARRALELLDDALPDAPVEAIGRVDLVALQALVQARNTLRAAWLLLFQGFEVQALALARLITEYVVLAWYVRSGLGDPQLWLQTDTRPPSTGEQLRALEQHDARLPELGEYVTKGRPILNRLAHQDPVAFSFAYRLEDDRPSFFRRAGALDAISLRRGGEYLLPLSLLVLNTAAANRTSVRDLLERDTEEWWERE